MTILYSILFYFDFLIIVFLILLGGAAGNNFSNSFQQTIPWKKTRINILRERSLKTHTQFHMDSAIIQINTNTHNKTQPPL